jgi:hypothetical protein
MAALPLSVFALELHPVPALGKEKKERRNDRYARIAGSADHRG